MSSSNTPQQATAKSRAWLVWIILSFLLVIIAGVAFYQATRQAIRHNATGASDDNLITVTIRDKQCHPNDITVPAGRTTFKIVNASDRGLEWEILDGVMVIDERENIAPGFSQTLKVKLNPGVFQITCGLLSSPRGTLTVTPSAQSEAEAAKPPITHFISALAEYMVYQNIQATELVQTTAGLNNALAAGNLPLAQEKLLAAHRLYKRIQPMTELLGDLDSKIDARVILFDKKEQDPAFTGFYRLEHLLLEQRDIRSAIPFGKQLTSDIADLQQRLDAMDILPEKLIGGASRLLRRTADNLPSDTANAATLSASIEGVREGTLRIYTLLQPLLTKASANLDKHMTAQFYRLEEQVTALSKENGTISDAQRQQLSDTITQLSADFQQMNSALGLE